MKTNKKIIDGNEAAAYMAYKTNDLCAIYPITPSSPMGEWADEWSSELIPNVWGDVPHVEEMQSEGGAAGAVHGALQAGSMATTFTSSQGLLLMEPNMFKIAGQFLPTVFHVAARSLATHALSIFGDHSDVMAVRQTGFGMLSASSVQEVMDFALIAQAASYQSKIPFLHFFDGFRTSHEVNSIQVVPDETIKDLMDPDFLNAHKRQAMDPEKPVIRGTAQNPDVFFQGREAGNRSYEALPSIMQKTMEKFAGKTLRKYNLFDYSGHPKADKVIVIMGSAAETVNETVQYLFNQDEKVGCITVRLFQPFSVAAFMKALPETAEKIAVLDRTKEPAANGEPLYNEVISALLTEQGLDHFYLDTPPKVIRGRYGLSSKELTPAMVKTIFDELESVFPKSPFTIGIDDDKTYLSLKVNNNLSIEEMYPFRGLFFGLGSDGTVGANKNTLKIVGDMTGMHVQGYFEYDSRKSGARTVSHLRWGKEQIRAPYLIEKANFIACHHFHFLTKYDLLSQAEKDASLLINAPFSPEQLWDHLPVKVKKVIQEKSLSVYVVDASTIARESGLGGRINTILQVCFFKVWNGIPMNQVVDNIKNSITSSYIHKGQKIVDKNHSAVDKTLERLYKVDVPEEAIENWDDESDEKPNKFDENTPPFIKKVLSLIMEGKGDQIPVSDLPADGTFPTGTTRYEKPDIAHEIPVWDEELCTQCNKCLIICPHSAIRAKIYDKKHLENAPSGFKYADPVGKEFEKAQEKYTLQISPMDCTGCRLCVETCPVTDKNDKNYKAINMISRDKLEEMKLKNEKQAELNAEFVAENEYPEKMNSHFEKNGNKQENSHGNGAWGGEVNNWNFFEKLPEIDRLRVKQNIVKGSQFLQPLFEFPSACSGCGETPYIKLLSQLFGDRMLLANATGCSSIYCGNLPSTPWTKNDEGRGPSWANSLFEDNAEFGLGMRLAANLKWNEATRLLKNLQSDIGKSLVKSILENPQKTEEEIIQQRRFVSNLKSILAKLDSSDAKNLHVNCSNLLRKSVWSIGGDGWAYDIGYGGLDHVIASGKDINLLVMDTEVYSNTGGQTSKATPRAASARFSVKGKNSSKKDLPWMAISYGNVYVAQIAMGANDMQTLRAINEAEAYQGPSLIIAYSHCIAHGYDMGDGIKQQKKAVDSGYWPLFRYNPEKEEGKKFKLESKPGSIPLEDYIYNEARFTSVLSKHEDKGAALLEAAKIDVKEKWKRIELLKQL